MISMPLDSWVAMQFYVNRHRHTHTGINIDAGHKSDVKGQQAKLLFQHNAYHSHNVIWGECNFP